MTSLPISPAAAAPPRWPEQDCGVDGPGLVAEALSWPRIPDKFGNLWQYHSRSDRHSKVACWAILFDLLEESATLRRHVEQDKVGFGVNHEMSDFHTRRKKNLDLVICRPGTPTTRGGRVPRSFVNLAGDVGVRLTPGQQRRMDALPAFVEAPVGSVLVALEAKACMTEHGKARPRLYDELSSSHLTVHGANDAAIAAAFVMVNAAGTFRSSDRNKFDLSVHDATVNTHVQPSATLRVLQKVNELRVRTRPGQEGFDAIGVVVVDCANDGSPVTVLSTPPALPPSDDLHYDQMVRRVAHLYDTQYASI
jgi:hypothetical protein